MRTLGLFIQQGLVKIALFSKVKNQLTLEKLQACSTLPLSLLQEKNLRIVTGLSTEEVVRREVYLNLRQERALLKALPFQVEPLLPFPPEETIAYPLFVPQGEGTSAVVFATTRAALQAHLSAMNACGIDPDQVSCLPLAYAQWARWMFPTQKLIALLQDTTGVVLEGEKIVFAHSFDDTERLKRVFQQRFGHHWRVGEEGPSVQDYSYATLREFAPAIGLALQGFETKACQFRQGAFVSSKQRRKKRALALGSLTLSLALACSVGGIGSWIVFARKAQLEKKINTYFTSSLPLEERIAVWQRNLDQEADQFPLLPDVPAVRDVLAWLGAIQEPIEIVQFNYSLVQYPKAGEKPQPYTVKIDLELRAESPAAAHRFKEALEKIPTLVDKKQKITWTAQKNSYKTSFWLRKT